jgi:hypothetical protein|tara:strand:- start:1819 stop:2601 length:783 start_codon:yes stop_codon:yes gene_type:complete
MITVVRSFYFAFDYHPAKVWPGDYQVGVVADLANAVVTQECAKIALAEGWAVSNEQGPGEWPPVPQLWKGETVCILGSGPSAKAADADYVHGKARLIVVNNAFRLAPWADLLYACDFNWWQEYKNPRDGGLSWVDFEGLLVSQDARAVDALRVPSEDKPGLSLDPLRIHQGANGGYQALNLAVLLGASRVLLLGFDMKGAHFHQDHPSGLNNPDQQHYARWMENYQTTLPDLKRAGVEVINCTWGSALKCYPKKRLKQSL